MTWDVYGKLRTVVFTSGDTILYTYDNQGSRLTKKDTSGTQVYVRDASGNTLSIFHQSTVQGTTRDTLREQMLYGSSRLGVMKMDRLITRSDVMEELDGQQIRRIIQNMLQNVKRILKSIGFLYKIATQTYCLLTEIHC